MALLVTLALATAACSDDGDSTASTVVGATDTAASTSDAPTTTVPLDPATFTVQPGTLQLAVLDADPGTELSVYDGDGAVAASGTVDELGSLLFRDLAPATYTVGDDKVRSDAFEVVDVDAVPPQSWYEEQPLLPAGGFGYIIVRDGTTLSANVMLPGPAEDGPYPTVVEYSGYQPSDPGSADLAQVYTAQGFAYVGVNMRGTGCSGGSFRYFETVQSLDGYDVIEAVAAQPWVDGKVGMVGISYPGIAQLYVAATTPPSLGAIAPISVLDDSGRSTLYPGGILNTGFAVDWTSDRMREAQPYGQAWTQTRADEGDEVCASNQGLRLQNPDLLQEIEDNPYYTEPLGSSLAPVTFVDQIDVPVFLAGAWQDEQTGGHFPAMLDSFTGSPHLYVDLVNGLHTESLSPQILARQMEFLQLYIGHRTPEIAFANGVLPILGDAIWGVTTFAPLTDRFAGMSYDDALAAFESDPPVRVFFEQGGDDAFAPGTPEPNFVVTFDSYPIATAEATVWQLDGNGALTDGELQDPGIATYRADPDALPATFYEGGGNDVWRADVQYDWEPLPAGTGVGFVTAPLAADTVVIGPGSVDLWVSADAADTDLEVTITEVRPDGTEIYVQSGWLRASHRALDEAASTELRPVHGHLEADASPMSAEVVPIRVELFPFGHPFRAGSRIRLTIDAPGNSRAIWSFDTVSDGETVTIAYDAEHPSRIVLSVVPGIEVPSVAPPACGALRGQPCRDYVPASNGG